MASMRTYRRCTWSLPPARRPGRHLVATVATAQRAHGATGLLVWVFAANHAARAFYE